MDLSPKPQYHNTTRRIRRLTKKGQQQTENTHTRARTHGKNTKNEQRITVAQIRTYTGIRHDFDGK